MATTLPPLMRSASDKQMFSSVVVPETSLEKFPRQDTSPRRRSLRRASSDAILYAAELYDIQEKSPWRVDVIIYIIAAILSLVTIIHVDIAGMLIPLVQNGAGGFLTTPENDALLNQTHICRVYDTEETNEHCIQKSNEEEHIDKLCGVMRRKNDTEVHLGWVFFKLHYCRVTHVDYGDAHFFSGSAIGVRTMFWRNPSNTSQFLGSFVHTGFGLMYSRGIARDIQVKLNAEGDIIDIMALGWKNTMGFPYYEPGFRQTFRLFKLFLVVAIKMILQILCLLEVCILIRLMWTHKGSVFSQGLPAMACSYRTKTQVGLLAA